MLHYTSSPPCPPSCSSTTQPVVPRPEESVSQLHSRYTAALLALGKQHNVQLNIVD